MFPQQMPLSQEKVWTLFRGQRAFCCHLFEKITVKMEIGKPSQSKLLLVVNTGRLEGCKGFF